jgi:hypothetical protein
LSATPVCHGGGNGALANPAKAVFWLLAPRASERAGASTAQA